MKQNIKTKEKSVAKPAEKEKPIEEKNIAIVTGSSLLTEDDDLTQEMQKDLRKGTSQRPEDNLVPLIYILQSNSPQVNKRNPDAYIEGAEAGDIWLRHAQNPIIKGDEGITFIPCYWFKDWVEWIPRDDGGGFVGRHKELPPEAVVEMDTKSRRAVNKMPNGNDLVETANHAGFVFTRDGRALPYLIPMKSTGLTISRQWMSLFNQKLNDEGEPYPSFSHKYHLTTKHRKNKEGEWFVFDVKDIPNGVLRNKTLYTMCQALEKAFESGQKQAEEEVHVGQTGTVNEPKDQM